jgi:hypothetical protein
MNTSATFLPAFILVTIYIVLGIVTHSPNKKLFGWGEFREYREDQEMVDEGDWTYRRRRRR